MGKILKPKVQASGLMDAFEMGILKTLSERTLTPVVGNGTFISGAAKIVGGRWTIIVSNGHRWRGGRSA